MWNLIPINIVIGDRTYRLKIEPADEEMVRKTVKLINEKIIEFKTNFAGKDMQDYIAMALIWLATEKAKPTSAQPEDKAPTLEKLSTIEMLIDKLLQK